MGIIDRPNELIVVVRETLGLKVFEKFRVNNVSGVYMFSNHELLLVDSAIGAITSSMSLNDLCHKRIERVL
jgi:hypothetical protein